MKCRKRNEPSPTERRRRQLADAQRRFRERRRAALHERYITEPLPEHQR